MKYTYSDPHKGLMPWPLMDEPRGPVVCDCWVCKDRQAAKEAYGKWLQETPLALVRDEDIEFFREAREENIDFEVVWYNFGGFDKPDDYGALAIPKKKSNVPPLQSRTGAIEDDSYPGVQYQRLFNAITGTAGIATQSEMDDIIRIVKEDFPADNQINQTK
jgi:hypothetical protein